MKCGECQDLLFEWLEGSLAAPARDSVQEHLGRCGPCRAAFEEERRFSDSMSTLLKRQTRGLRLSPETGREVLAKLKRRGERSGRTRFVGLVMSISSLAAAACLLVVCGVIFWRSPPPPDAPPVCLSVSPRRTLAAMPGFSLSPGRLPGTPPCFTVSTRSGSSFVGLDDEEG